MSVLLRDTISRRGAEIYIGQAQFAHDRIAKIKPLAVATENSWRHVVASEFPSEGLVFSVDPTVVGKEKGFVVLFTMEPNQKGKGEEYYVTTRVCEPYEVVASFETLSKDKQRIAATKSGFDRGLQRSPRVVLPLEGGKCAFPEVQYDDRLKKWFVSSTETLAAIEIL